MHVGNHSVLFLKNTRMCRKDVMYLVAAGDFVGLVFSQREDQLLSGYSTEALVGRVSLGPSWLAFKRRD